MSCRRSIILRLPSNSESVVTEEEEGFDDLLSKIGFGKWQLIILLSPLFAISGYPVHLLGASLLNAPLRFHCSTGQMDTCDGDAEHCRNNSSNNYLSNNDTYYNSQCLSSAVNLTTLQMIANLNLSETQHRTSLPSCPIIEYDTSVFTSTVVSEWDLVCERSYLRPLFVTLGTVGNIFGSLLGGYIGDRWGRLWAVKLTSLVNIIFIVVMVTAPYYSLLLVTRLITGCFLCAALIPAWNLAIETAPSKHRSLVGMLLGLPFSGLLIGYAGMAYLIRSWRYLLLAGSSPVLLLFPCSFLGTESPRWLLQQARFEEARKVLHKAKKLNGAKLDSPIRSYVEKVALNHKTDSADDLESECCNISCLGVVKTGLSYLRSPAMRTIILGMGVIWILQNILYVGVGLNAHKFESDSKFIYVALTGVMDATAIILITPLTSFFGRRVFLFAGFAIGGILFFLELIVPSSYDWIRWVMVMSGFFLVAGSLQVNFLYSPELFPTEIRGRGFAAMQLLGNVGASIAPFITDILSQYSEWGPGVAFGCAGILGGLVIPFLPETRNKPLPETVQDVEDARKKAKGKKQNLQGVENKSYTEDVSHHE